jgi:hypothetical protein
MDTGANNGNPQVDSNPPAILGPSWEIGGGFSYSSHVGATRMPIQAISQHEGHITPASVQSRKADKIRQIKKRADERAGSGHRDAAGSG